MLASADGPDSSICGCSACIFMHRRCAPRLLSYAGFRASAWLVGRICPREGAGAAQCAGQAVPAGQAPDQAGIAISDQQARPAQAVRDRL
jgi:hypothetical protein